MTTLFLRHVSTKTIPTHLFVFILVGFALFVNDGAYATPTTNACDTLCLNSNDPSKTVRMCLPNENDRTTYDPICVKPIQVASIISSRGFRATENGLKNGIRYGCFCNGKSSSQGNVQIESDANTVPSTPAPMPSNVPETTLPSVATIPTDDDDVTGRHGKNDTIKTRPQMRTGCGNSTKACDEMGANLIIRQSSTCDLIRLDTNLYELTVTTIVKKNDWVKPFIGLSPYDVTKGIRIRDDDCDNYVPPPAFFPWNATLWHINQNVNTDGGWTLKEVYHISDGLYSVVTFSYVFTLDMISSCGNVDVSNDGSTFSGAFYVTNVEAVSQTDENRGEMVVSERKCMFRIRQRGGGIETVCFVVHKKSFDVYWTQSMCDENGRLNFVIDTCVDKNHELSQPSSDSFPSFDVVLLENLPEWYKEGKTCQRWLLKSATVIPPFSGVVRVEWNYENDSTASSLKRDEDDDDRPENKATLSIHVNMDDVCPSSTNGEDNWDIVVEDTLETTLKLYLDESFSTPYDYGASDPIPTCHRVYAELSLDGILPESNCHLFNLTIVNVTIVSIYNDEPTSEWRLIYNANGVFDEETYDFSFEPPSYKNQCFRRFSWFVKVTNKTMEKYKIKVAWNATHALSDDVDVSSFSSSAQSTLLLIGRPTAFDAYVTDRSPFENTVMRDVSLPGSLEGGVNDGITTVKIVTTKEKPMHFGTHSKYGVMRGWVSENVVGRHAIKMMNKRPNPFSYRPANYATRRRPEDSDISSIWTEKFRSVVTTLKPNAPNVRIAFASSITKEEYVEASCTSNERWRWSEEDNACVLKCQLNDRDVSSSALVTNDVETQHHEPSCGSDDDYHRRLYFWFPGLRHHNSEWQIVVGVSLGILALFLLFLLVGGCTSAVYYVNPRSIARGHHHHHHHHNARARSSYLDGRRFIYTVRSEMQSNNEKNDSSSKKPKIVNRYGNDSYLSYRVASMLN